MASKPKKARSPVWEYFDLLDDTQVICCKCKEKIPRTKGSTWNMLAHLKSKHGIDLSGEPKKHNPKIGASTSNMESIQEVEKVKDIMKSVHDKINQETELNRFLKRKISDLENSKRELVGVFGRTGAGKSSLINAIIGEKDLLPCGDTSACTSVMIQVQANMTDSKYIAEIEFIPAKDWEDELWDYLKNPDSAKDEEGDTEDDDIKEKISALYGKDAKNFLDVADYMDNKNFREIPEFRQSQKKTLSCKTSSDLSEKIAKYTRRDIEEDEEETRLKTGTQYWPLVKCVTIKVPNASKLLQHVALIDLPGTGDCNKSRDEMWKRFVGDCSAVWIVSSDTSRVDSAKEPWEILNQTISLIGNGGECQSISFICTQSDVIDDKYKKSNNEARDHVLQKNKRVKERVRKRFDKEKEVIKKHFSGDGGFFQVFTVTSKDLNELKYLQADDTEIPQLQKFLKDLNDHQSKTNYYVSGAYGILSLMKAANTPDTGSLKVVVCKELETRLVGWKDEVDRTMMKCKDTFEKCLDEGVTLSMESCESILKGVTKGKTVGQHHSSLKSLVQNNGIYKKLKNRRKTEVNLNEKLSKHLRESIDQEFSKTFPNEGRPGPIKEAIDKFTLDTDSLSDKHKGVALQMTFLKTEEEKLKKKLANVIREEKKNIYSSITKSIQESMQPCYDKAAKHRGPGMLDNTRQEMNVHLFRSKYSMFVKAKECMLDKVESLKNKLLKTLQEDMQISIDHSLKTNDDTLPDVTKQYEEVKIIYDKLKSSSRRSANTGMKESPECPSPSTSSLSKKSDKSMNPPINLKTQTWKSDVSTSSLSMKSDKSMNPPINLKTQTWKSDVSSSEFSSSVLTADDVTCCLCLDTMKDPVSIPCGHSYCKHCINTCWTQPSPKGDYVCPMCMRSYRGPVRPELSLNVTLSWMLECLQRTARSTLTQTGSGEAACDVCSSFKPCRAVKTCLTCSVSYCENHLREHYSVPALQKHTLAPVSEDTRPSEQECSSGRMWVIKEEPMCESEEHQEIACKRGKLAGEEEDEIFQPKEQSDLNTQIHTKAEPKLEKHDLREQLDLVKDCLTSEQIKEEDQNTHSTLPPRQTDRTMDTPPHSVDSSQPNVSMSPEKWQPSCLNEVDHSNMDITIFTPIVHRDHTTNEYSFRLRGAGLFECRNTGLVFQTTGETTVLYKAVQWEERWLQSTGGTPASPLFDIQSSQDEEHLQARGDVLPVSQLRLPHCLVTPGDDDLSVAHITEEGVELLKPLEVTKTHVIVNVTNLSFWGLVSKLFKQQTAIHGQVLLFLRPPSHILEMKVLLLPNNVDIEQVRSTFNNREDKYIDTSTACLLTPEEVYSLHCPPHDVQPEDQPYHPNYGPNFTPTFEVEIKDLNTEVVLLEVQGPEKNTVWKRRVRVNGKRASRKIKKNLESKETAPGSKIVTETQLMQVANKTGTTWKRIGTMLGIPEVTMQHIEMDEPRHVDRVYQMLLHWRKRRGKNATALYLHSELTGLEADLVPDDIDFLLEED